MNRSLIIAFATLCLHAFGGSLQAQALDTTENPSQSNCADFDILFVNSSPRNSPEDVPLCGIKSMGVAVATFGRSLPLNDGVSSVYLSDPRQGSSITDLINLAELADLCAESYEGLSIDSLRELTTPAILNLSVNSAEECGGHWVTFLGFQGHKVRLYDSMARPTAQEISAAELLTRWNGHAIILYERQPTRMQVAATYWARAMPSGVILVFAAVLFWVALSCGRSISISQRGFPVQAFLIIAIALAATCCYCLTETSSLFRNRTAALWMFTFLSPRAEDFELMKQDEVLSISANGSCYSPEGVLVDARIGAPRRPQQIPGSVHVGVDFDIVTFRHAVSHWHRKARIGVFCNSKECRWADSVALRFRVFGFSNIAIYREGVEGYFDRLAPADK